MVFYMLNWTLSKNQSVFVYNICFLDMLLFMIENRIEERVYKS